MSKYLDQLGLKKVVEAIAAKIDLKLSSKVSAVASADETQIQVDNTDPNNPKVGLAAAQVDKINQLWTLTDNGTGIAVSSVSDEEIDTIITDAFK